MLCIGKEGSATTSERVTECFCGTETIDWFQHGISHKNLNQHFSLTFLDAVAGRIPLTQILDSQKVAETPEPPEGRVRDHTEADPGLPREGRADRDSDQMSQSLGGFDDDEQRAFIIAQSRCNLLLHPKAPQKPVFHSDDCCFKKPEGRFYYLTDEGDFTASSYFPVEKLNRSLTPEELIVKHVEVKAAKKSELLSWVKLNR